MCQEEICGSIFISNIKITISLSNLLPRVINSSIKSYVIFIRVNRYRIFCIEICSTILEEEYYLNEVVGKFIVSR